MNIRYEKIPQVFIERYWRQLASCATKIGMTNFRLHLIPPARSAVITVEGSEAAVEFHVQAVNFFVTQRHAVRDPWYSPERRHLVQVVIEPASDADLDTIIHHSLMLRAEEHPL